MKKQGIYIFTNLVNNKVYIGSSVNLEKRQYEHLRLLNLGQHENKHFQNAWNKYGESNFKYEIIEEVDVIENFDENNRILRNLETKYITQYNSANPNYGYNFIPGGIGTQGLPCSEEKKQKISEANKGRIAHNLGVPMSEEQKQKLRKISAKAYGKSIDIYNINKIFIETLPSIREVNRKYGIGRNTIKDCCENLTFPIKYIFRYHGESLKTVGSKRITKKEKRTEEESKKIAIDYRNNRGRKIDVYDNFGNFIKTFPALVAIHETYRISESTIYRGLKTKELTGGFFFREHGEPLGDIQKSLSKYHSKAAKCSNLCFFIYKNNDLIEIIKYKKDIDKYAKYREKSKLQKLITECNKCGDTFKYHEFIIKFDIAPNNSNIINESRQLNMDVIEGTDNSANGEA